MSCKACPWDVTFLVLQQNLTALPAAQQHKAPAACTVMHGPQMCPMFNESTKMDLNPRRRGIKTEKIKILKLPRGTRRLGAPLETTATATLLSNEPTLTELL